jgi:hypothetical protein
VLRAGRRGLQMVLRLLAHNAEHWLSGHLNAYLQDDDEYRAITRETIIRGLAGTIEYAPGAITVTLEPPRSRRVARALALLIDEINATPPAMPATPAPSPTRSPRNQAFNPVRTAVAGDLTDLMTIPSLPDGYPLCLINFEIIGR